MIEPKHHNWRVIRDLATDESTLEVINDAGEHYIPEIDMQTGRKALECYSSQGEDFNSVRGETWWRRTYQRGDWRIKIITRTVLTSSATDFYLRGAYR